MALKEASPLSVGGELHRLLESGEYWTCLAQGRDLLEQGLPEDDRARVLAVLCRCHLALGHMAGAVASGEMAAALAGRLGLRDLEGAALLDLSLGLAGLRRHEEALAALERFRQGLDAYTASRVLEGAALKQTAEVLGQMGRHAEAADWFGRARQWFHRYGDERAAGDCLLEIIGAGLAEGDLVAVGHRLAEAEAQSLSDPGFTARLLLARARYYRMAGRNQESVDEAFKAMVLAEPLGRVQVEAQLHLSRMAELMKRPVDGLSFAFAARTSAIDGRLYTLEFEASALLMRQIRRYGTATVAELAAELEQRGVDLYQYISLDEVERLVHGE
jgi:tetratricopeptide (TPR) repeat protein